MKIVVAPNALKGSLSAARAAEAMSAGIRAVLPHADIRAIPVADGGDGLIAALRDPLSAEVHTQTVSGPLGVPTSASFLYIPQRKLAIIEMAAAAGLTLLKDDQLDSVAASSKGVGELIIAALDLGCQQIVLGLGGSATTDGATGLAVALGMRFLDKNGSSVAGNGANLEHIRTIDRRELDVRLASVKFDVACDVDNPLLGEHGAARVYAPQKGAGAEQIRQLERGLMNLASVIEQDTGRDVRALAGGGAAGGMGAGLVAFVDAELKPGAQLVLEILDIEQAIADADLVLTSEGRLDQQTRFGKAPAAVAGLAKQHKVPCIAIAGMLDDDAYQLHEVGIDAVFSLCPGPVSLQDAIENAANYLSRSTEQILRCVQRFR